MKKLIKLTLFAFLPFSTTFCQDSIQFTLMGNIFDDTLLTPVSYPIIEVRSQADQTFRIKGDYLGNYKLIGTIPSGYVLFNLMYRDKKHQTSRFQWDTTTTKDFVIEKNVRMNSLDCCEENIIPVVIFKRNSTDLFLPELADSSIREVAKIMIDHPEITILAIVGHSCYDEESKPDTLLSFQRAEVVMSKLVDKGVDRRRLIPRGFGAKKLLVDSTFINNACKTEESKALFHKKNRRVIFNVVK